MKRFPKQLVARGMFLAASVALTLAGVSPPDLDDDKVELFCPGHPVASKELEESSPDVPPLSQQPPMSVSRRSVSGTVEREPGRAFLGNLSRALLRQRTVNPGFGSKLDLCAEFTKPDSLVLRLMGTPKNHRSPPA